MQSVVPVFATTDFLFCLRQLGEADQLCELCVSVDERDRVKIIVVPRNNHPLIFDIVPSLLQPAGELSQDHQVNNGYVSPNALGHHSCFNAIPLNSD